MFWVPRLDSGKSVLIVARTAASRLPLLLGTARQRGDRTAALQQLRLALADAPVFNGMGAEFEKRVVYLRNA